MNPSGTYQLDTVDSLSARQFEIAVRRLADSLAYGTDVSPFVGSGTDYAQSRIYQPGDPVKAIDWRVTARTNKVFIKEYETPKRMPCYMLVDTSASMTLSSTQKSKYALAVHIAGGLALACLDRLSPVALLAVGERELRYRPDLSRGTVMRWLHDLRHFRVDEKTELAWRIRELGSMLYSHSLIIALTDLQQPDAIAPLKRLAQQHDVVAIQLRDPVEDELKGTGFIQGREAETGSRFVTRRSLGMDQEQLTQELKRARVDHLVISTTESPAYRLRHFFQSRGLLGKGAR